MSRSMVHPEEIVSSPAQILDAPLPVHREDAAPAGPETWRAALDRFRTGDYRSAALLFGLIARVGPRRQRARVALASVLMNLGRLPAAIQTLETALEEHPDDPIATLNLATAQYCAGLYSDALRNACAAVPLFRSADLGVARPRHLQGLIHLAVGRLDRAERLLEDALEADPAFVPAAVGLVRCAALRGDIPRARLLLQRARRMLPDAPPGVRSPTERALERLAEDLRGGVRRRLRRLCLGAEPREGGQNQEHPR